MNLPSNTPSLHHSITPALLVLAAEEFHDIVPPVDYSLIPPWLVFVILFVALSLLGLVVWLFAKRRKPPQPPKLPRELALESRTNWRNENTSPYHSVSRVQHFAKYVTQQYGLSNATNFD
jgi:hypothetical protein